MKKPLFTISRLCTVIFTVVTTTSAFSQEVRIDAVKDTYIQGGSSADLNFNDEGIMRVKNHSDESYVRQGLLGFDLSETDPGGLTSVSLLMNGRLDDGGIIAIYPVSDHSWNEATVTWNTKPLAGETEMATLTIAPSNVHKVYAWDISAYILEQLSQGKTEISLMIKQLDATAYPPRFHVKEGGEAVSQLLFEPADQANALLRSIVIGDFEENILVEGETGYTYFMPYTHPSVPSVTALPVVPEADVTINDAVNLTGSEEERTTTITVTSLNGSVQEKYTILFGLLPEMDLYLLTGQSNMAGRGEILPDYTGVIDDTYLFKGNGDWTEAENPLNLFSNIRKAASMQKMNPGYGFATKLSSTLPEKQFGLVVNARGGTSISELMKGNASGYYELTLERIQTAARYGTVRAILWHQGESDRNKSDYLQALNTLVTDYRTDLGIPDLPVFAGQLGKWRSDSEPFNTNLTTIADHISNSYWIASDGFGPINNDFSDPHFNGESQVTFGKRYAASVLKNVYLLDNLSEDAGLASIAVDSEDLTGVSPGTYSYEVPLTEQRSVPRVTAVANDAGATVSIIQATAVEGSADDRTAKIWVTAEDGSIELYTVTFYLDTTQTSDSGAALLNDKFSIIDGPGNRIIIELHSDMDGTVKVYNLSGSCLMEIQASPGINEITLSTPGMYILSIRLDSGTYTGKVVVQG
jgi:hypothetical protein